jgi:hypothetical protein
MAVLVMPMTDHARGKWAAVYSDLSAGKPVFSVPTSLAPKRKRFAWPDLHREPLIAGHRLPTFWHRHDNLSLKPRFDVARIIKGTAADLEVARAFAKVAPANKR